MSHRKAPVIIERAIFNIVPGQEAAFEAAYAEAFKVIEAADGIGAITMARGIESPSTYLLIAEWDTVEHHTVGFRESESFLRWRELIGPYFDGLPAVEHYAPLED